MKTFFKKASLPRQLRKKHFLREYNSVALFSQDRPPPFPGRPYVYQDGGRKQISETLAHLLGWQGHTGGAGRRREVWKRGIEARPIRIPRWVLDKEIFIFIQANSEESNIKRGHFFSEDCKHTVFLS